MLVFVRNRATNVLRLILGLFFKISGTSTRVIQMLSNAGVCVSGDTAEGRASYLGCVGSQSIHLPSILAAKNCWWPWHDTSQRSCRSPWCIWLGHPLVNALIPSLCSSRLVRLTKAALIAEASLTDTLFTPITAYYCRLGNRQYIKPTREEYIQMQQRDRNVIKRKQLRIVTD
jgi:hypothetical protein